MEYSRLWRNDQLKGVELLKASFQRFSFAKHWHDELSIGVIEKGAEGLNYRGSRLVIPERHIVAINPAEVHTGFSGCDQGWTYRMFYFDTALVSSVVQDVNPKLQPFLASAVINDEALFQRLRQLHLSLDQDSLVLSKQSLLVIALSELFERHGEQRVADMKVYKEQQKNNRLRDYMLAHWQQNISLEQLEVLSGLSKYQLIRSFSQQFGVTPHQFLLLVKVHNAKQLLGDGLSCVNTALECGFFDQSHLTRNFKRVFGITPKSYLS